MTENDSVERGLIKECIFRIRHESMPRIRTCYDAVDEDALWRRENDSVVSIGNLMIHLAGNLRQWIVCGLGGQPIHRDRDAEFNERGPIPKEHVWALLEDAVRDAVTVMEELPPGALLKPYKIQGFDVNGISILVHVVEHVSYHTGQITYMVKSGQNINTHYYEQDLNIE